MSGSAATRSTVKRHCTVHGAKQKRPARLKDKQLCPKYIFAECIYGINLKFYVDVMDGTRYNFIVIN